MTELIVGKLLDTANAFLVEEFHIVAGITVEEVVGTYTQPEQVYLLVGIVCLIIDIGDVCGRK